VPFEAIGLHASGQQLELLFVIFRPHSVVATVQQFLSWDYVEVMRFTNNVQHNITELIDYRVRSVGLCFPMVPREVSEWY